MKFSDGWLRRIKLAALGSVYILAIKILFVYHWPKHTFGQQLEDLSASAWITEGQPGLEAETPEDGAGRMNLDQSCSHLLDEGFLTDKSNVSTWRTDTCEIHKYTLRSYNTLKISLFQLLFLMLTLLHSHHLSGENVSKCQWSVLKTIVFKL